MRNTKEVISEDGPLCARTFGEVRCGEAAFTRGALKEAQSVLPRRDQYNPRVFKVASNRTSFH